MYSGTISSNVVNWVGAGLILGLLTSFVASDKTYIKSIKKHRKERRREFRDPRRSPLREGAKQFKRLVYYEISPEYRVEARLEETPEAIPFKIPTSDTNVTKDYVSFGKLHFTLGGRAHQLIVYKSLALSRLPQYRSYLFLPFRDETTGRESYGGGRYLDLQIPEGKHIQIDFNLAYNPNCAYSEGWACPIPPAENTLDVPVKAGEKNYPR